MAKRNRHISSEAWWSTAIIEMKPGTIAYRGYAVEDLIGRVGFAEMVWLLIPGDLPRPAEAKLLEAALVAITCGVSINNAMASAVNVPGFIVR